MPFLDLDGARIHYDEAGAGRPVVFVHGWSMSGRFFRAPLPHSGLGHRALAPDLRAHGRSPAVHAGQPSRATRATCGPSWRRSTSTGWSWSAGRWAR